MTIQRILCAAVLGMSLSVPGLLPAGAPADSAKSPIVDIGNQAWTQPLFGGGVKTSDVYTDGNIFFTLPFWSTLGKDGTLGGDYIFLEPYSSLGDKGEVAASLGLSWRHLFSDEPTAALHKQGVASLMEEGWFVGGNVFLDMMDTQYNNNFWQMGVGAEVGTRYFEVRGNYYIPMTGEKLYDRSVDTRSFTSSSSSTAYNTVTQVNDPYASGNSILQGTSSQTFASTTTATTTTTVKTITELFEKGMEGWDAEASVLVPWLDQWMDLRLIGGYFSFNNQPFGPADGPTGPVHGWKAGAELRPVPAVVLGGMWFEDKRFIGSSWMVSAELQIPMDKTWKDAFKVRRRHLAEHLAEPVHRQNDAIKMGNREDQQTSVSSTSSVKRVTKVVAQSSTQIVLKDDIVFVNNSGPVGNGIQAGSAAGNGTAEHPVSTIQIGANLAQANSNSSARVWNVYTQGTTIPYVESVSATVGSVNFIGSGQRIMGQNGKSFGAGPAPSVTGDIQASKIGFLGVSGYQFTGLVPGHAGISATDVAKVVIMGNSFTNSGAAGIHVAYTEANTTGVVAISGNGVIGSQGAGIEVFLPATSTVIIADNAVSQSTGAGIAVSNTSAVSSADLTVAGNTVSQSSGDGIGVNITGTTLTVKAGLDSNTIGNSGGDGLKFVVAGVVQSGFAPINGTLFPFPVQPVYTGSSVSATIAGNTITNSSGNGLSLDVQNGTLSLINFDVSVVQTVFNATVSGNSVVSSGGSGLVFNYRGLSPTASATVTGNSVAYSGSRGMDITTSSFIAQLDEVVTGNSVVNSGSDGLRVSIDGISSAGSTVSGNTVANSARDGLSIIVSNDFRGTSLSVTNNSIYNSGGAGLRMTINSAVSSLVAVISGNTISKSGQGLIVSLSSGIGSPTIAITGNTIADSLANGLSVNMNPIMGNPTIAVTSNTVTNSTANGISLVGSGTLLNISYTQFNLNTVFGYQGSGIVINDSAASTSVNGTLNAAFSNTVNPVPGTGISRVFSIGAPTGSFYLNGVQVNLPAIVP